ncbi:hypothetical protein P5673_024034, partial [Acropora cervicornis]
KLTFWIFWKPQIIYRFPARLTTDLLTSSTLWGEEKFTIETKLKICWVAENHNLPELHEEIVHAVALQFVEICSEKAFMENVLLLPSPHSQRSQCAFRKVSFSNERKTKKTL